MKRQLLTVALLALSFVSSCRSERRSVQTDRKPQHPVVDDARLVASPKSRFVGPMSENPFGGVGPAELTEAKCKDMGCRVVDGSGPAFATWCGCGSGASLNYTWIHD
jgi:hypothetical protein